jgi:hypothetical protein
MKIVSRREIAGFAFALAFDNPACIAYVRIGIENP